MVLTWLGRAAATGLGLLASVLVGVVALLLVAALSAEPAVFVTVGAVVAVGAWFAVHRVLRRSPALASSSVAGVGALVVLAAIGSTVIPLGDPVVAPEVPPGSGTWHLPDGGRLAYGVVRARENAPDAAPVVVLHGGPGVPDTAGLLEVFGPLAARGHDVWAYDQRGAGRSSRLQDPGGYSTARAVTDLEVALGHIGAERVILVGHSYGAYLAAAYIAEHPGRVERAVFLSPGDLEGRSAGAPEDRLTVAERWRLYRLLLTPRALLTYGLVQVDPAAAHAFAGDREVDARQDRVYAANIPGLHCSGHTGPALHGAGFYANVVPPSWHGPGQPDIAGRLGHPPVPVLVVKGRCDYLDWESATGYLTAFPDSRLVYLRDAGHDVHVDAPTRVRRAVEEFVSGRPVSGVLESPMRAPADFQP